MTQEEKILEFIRNNGEISQRDAVRFGCFRLSARIYDLRAAGFNITKEFRSFKNDSSRGRYAVYRLKEEGNEQSDSNRQTDARP